MIARVHAAEVARQIVRALHVSPEASAIAPLHVAREERAPRKPAKRRKKKKAA